MQKVGIRSLFGNIRFYVLTFSVLFSIGVYFWVTATIPDGSLQIIRLTQVYALTAITFLYLALLAGPLCYTFRFLPFRGHYLKARRAIGFSAFYFGAIHGSFAFFGELGGFGGLAFLSGKYLLAITLSFTGFIILSLMAATSFDFMVAKLTFPKWKLLHRFVYLAGVLILIHAFMLGTHFQNLSELIPQILFGALAVLFLLEAHRFDAFLQRKFLVLPRFGITLLLVACVILTYLVLAFFPLDNAAISLGIHSQHTFWHGKPSKQIPVQLAVIFPISQGCKAIGRSDLP